MALPNYAPAGTIRFGSVPWDSSYVNVRLYTSLSEQYNDISSVMTTSAGTDDYAYIGRNRRIKVEIAADRLYHCNYCMYQNASVGTGWIYAFVTDVEYVNDHTSQLTIETDVFQTYLYSVDWSIPACFVERETVSSESTDYMLTPEPDFPLIYTVDDFTSLSFRTDASAGFIILTASQPDANDNIIEDIINPSGYYAKPAPVQSAWGVPMGCAMYYCPRDSTSGDSETLEQFLNQMNYAGSVESIVAVFSIPAFAASGLSSGWMNPPAYQLNKAQPATGFLGPVRGATVDGYTPRNSKVLYYPYNFMRLRDYNGSSTELRYELMDGTNIDVFYTPSPSCKAFVAPRTYMGKEGFDVGFVTDCGGIGSWVNDAYKNWLAQNSGTIMLTIAGVALAGAAGVTGIAAANSALSAGARTVAGGTAYTGASLAAAESSYVKGTAALGLGAHQAAGLGAQAINASHQPALTRGQADMNLMFTTGLQGVYAERVCVRAEIAKQIDEFFDRWGYEVDRVKPVDITSRQSWNYVKTQGAAPRSANAAAGTSAPFSRGRGTPAEALDVIRSRFDAGVTFWHTTSGFGDFSLGNGVS